MNSSRTRRYTGHRTARLVAVGLALTVAAAACGDDGGATGDGLAGTVSGDGSSTVLPIMEAVAEDFRIEHPDVSIQVGSSGTGGGFEKFCQGETQFSNASRAIADDEEAACGKSGVEFTEFLIASDGLSVVTNTELDIDCLTTDELKRLWSDTSITRYSQLRPGLPDQEIKLFGPGPDSGTYDFFLEEILGKTGKFRSDAAVTTSENDNQLVQGIEGSRGGLGYFGYAYYAENKDKLNLVKVDGGKGCIEPSADTVRDGTYAPLARPLYVYVATKELAKPEVAEMMRFLLTDGRTLVDEVGYVQRTDTDYEAALAKLPAS